VSDLLTVALVCASTLAPADCTRETALDVIVAPARSPVECLIRGQTTVAATGLASGEGTYVKVSCERRRIVTAMPVPRPVPDAAEQ
jgi:hypothetical protein